ncbi:unnamed protein product [Mytilus edulis]|uniref:Uncharacterized protein n=1 Tax=Mytilus edulis TaxID=6550 RepID=A0A8S3TAW0_MYTED|nr:unnamed protein product [Mytilus edulis]
MEILISDFGEELLRVQIKECRQTLTELSLSNFAYWKENEVNPNYNFYFDLVCRQAVAPNMFNGKHMICQNLLPRDLAVRTKAPNEIKEFIENNESSSMFELIRDANDLKYTGISMMTQDLDSEHVGSAITSNTTQSLCWKGTCSTSIVGAKNVTNEERLPTTGVEENTENNLNSCVISICPRQDEYNLQLTEMEEYIIDLPDIPNEMPQPSYSSTPTHILPLRGLNEAQKKRIILNICGTKFESCVQTLQNDPSYLLSRMFAPDSPLQPYIQEPHPSYFLDRSTTFCPYIELFEVQLLL